MKFLNQPILLVTLASLAVCKITPHKDEGVHRNDHQAKTHNTFTPHKGEGVHRNDHQAKTHKAFAPLREEGLYRYDHEAKTHTKIGTISRSHQIPVPVPPKAAGKPGLNSKKLPHSKKLPSSKEIPHSREMHHSKEMPHSKKVARSLMFLNDMDSFDIDFDLLARGFLDEEEDMLEDFYIRDAEHAKLGHEKVGHLLPGAHLQTHNLKAAGKGHEAQADAPNPQVLTTESFLTTSTAPPGGLITNPGTISPRGGLTFPANKVQCKQEIVTGDDFSAAYESLAIKCKYGFQVDKRTSIYAVSGQAMVYMCNYVSWWGTRQCTAPDMWNAFTQIQKQCTDYSAGWVHDSSGYVSYGLALVGEEICGF